MKSQLIAIVAAVLLVGCGGASIHQAAYQGNIEAVKQFIAAGADVNAKSSRNGSTPLHQADMGNHREIVELLIAKGADVNMKNSEGETSLDIASDPEVNQTEIAALLRKHGGKTGDELKAEGN